MRYLLVRAVVALPLISLVLLLAGCVSLGVALELEIVPSFDHQFTLNGRHMLTIHHGSTGVSCSPDQVSLEQCARRGTKRREFSIRHISPERAQMLLVIRLPER